MSRGRAVDSYGDDSPPGGFPDRRDRLISKDSTVVTSNRRMLRLVATWLATFFFWVALALSGSAVAATKLRAGHGDRV